jgi:hypothetical protein
MARNLHTATCTVWSGLGRNRMSCRIERVASGQHVVLRVSGRIRAEDIQTLKASLGADVVAFDLTEVTIVDRDVVAFLARCERQGIPCKECSPFLRGWLDVERRRVEGGDDTHQR